MIQTYAFLTVRKRNATDVTRGYNQIKEAIWLLRSSQFRREKRTNEDAIGLPESVFMLIRETVVAIGVPPCRSLNARYLLLLFIRKSTD